jgi:hypothetical protein
VIAFICHLSILIYESVFLLKAPPAISAPDP